MGAADSVVGDCFLAVFAGLMDLGAQKKRRLAQAPFWVESVELR